LLIEDTLSPRLRINIGKGGVGKSVVSAAMALSEASQGKRVLVCEVNTRGRMQDLLGGSPPPTFENLDEIWQIRDNIWTVNIDPWPSMKEYVVQVLRLKLVYNLVFENRYMRYFLTAIPGLQELVYMGKIWFHVEETLAEGGFRFDRVIVDAPATGHGFAMLNTPRVVCETVPVGPMHTAAEKILNVLQDERLTEINLISLPEDMPANETIELADLLAREAGLTSHRLFLNQWPSPAVSVEQRELFEALLSQGLQDEEQWALFAAARQTQHRVQEAESISSRLTEEIHLPVIHLPLLNKERGDAALVEELATFLNRGHTDVS
jgi:anion-transporting  ArsA/GET3 family ATPase